MTKSRHLHMNRAHSDIFVKVIDASNTDVWQHTYRLTFGTVSGLSVHRVTESTGDASVCVLDLTRDKSLEASASHKESLGMLSTWFETVIARSISIFNSAHVWGCIMVVLQIITLLLLTFEAPGPREVLAMPENMTAIGLVDYVSPLASPDLYALNYTSTARFISDNIRDHRGFGSVMLVAFSGSYLLMVCVMAHWSIVAILIIAIVVASGGGLGVVLFHNKEWHMHHMRSAAVFIAGGILTHSVVILSTHNNRHRMRDFILIATPVALAVLFLIFYAIAYHESNGDRQISRENWWISAIFEYLLYLSMTALNLCIPGRLVQHAANKFANMVPAIIIACDAKGAIIKKTQ